MRKCLSAFLVLAVGAMFVPAAPSALAADLGVTKSKKARYHAPKRLRVVRDYDGTPVVVHRIRPVKVVGPYGLVVVQGEYYHQRVVRPQPLYYFNGQPVMSRLVLRNYY